MKEYYRVQANIDLDAIYHNIENAKKIINKDTKMMAVIKADGYGHGAVAIAKTIDEIVDAYGVAIVEEAIELRNASINRPILILGTAHEKQYETIVKYDASQTIYRIDMADKLNAIGKRFGKKASVHIKIDTGMSRIGMDLSQESMEDIITISKMSHISLDGIFTHFACADETDKTSVNGQMKAFSEFVQQLEKQGVVIPNHHVSNSASIIDLPQANLNMVRSGILTYGLYPSEEVKKQNLELERAMSIKTYITYIKEVPKGTGISYNSTYVTTRRTRVATIPVGYADGYPRQLSSKGRVLIKGHAVPILGRICMDQFMVDVTDFDDIMEWDTVTLVGNDKDECITVEELATLAGSFNYEFVCDIGKRIPRVYYRSGRKVGTFDYYECTDKALYLID